MKHNRFFLLLAFALLLPSAALATEANINWEKATDLGSQPSVVTKYSNLGGTGSSRFYKLTVVTPTSYQIDLDIDGTLQKTFQPRLVLYRPDTVTAGPALPMTQPPSTIAAVYATSEQTIEHEGPWLSLVNHRFHASLSFEAAGTYYLAVYNAGTIGGPVRLTMLEGDRQLSMWQAKMRWLQTTYWVSAQWWNLLVPIAAAVVAGCFWFIIHRVPHPKQRHVKKR